MIVGALRPPVRWPAVAAALASLAGPLAGQVGVLGTDTTEVVADPGDVLGGARSAQARYERARERHLPLTLATGGGTCDEVVGRLCTWFGEGEWIPAPDPAELTELRRGLLAELDSLQPLSPPDAWIVGQRVWYRAEAGEWEGALEVARSCESEVWWCGALVGLALHGLERYREAEAAFGNALALMPPDLARRWRLPERAVDSDARDELRKLQRAGPEAVGGRLALLWRMADPLYLVDGNDRLTAHYARWTVATLKDGARNPFRLRWGEDLEELTVRHGWEIGWERSPSRRLGGPYTITGHRHPEAREYMPSGQTLAHPAASAADEFLADGSRPKSLYAPPYAPVMMPMEAQIAVFPRVDEVVVVATAYLPEDTSFHAEHDHERPWTEPGAQRGMPDRIGLFAWPVARDGGAPMHEVRTGATEGALHLTLREGGHVVSVESWSPELRFAGRLRRGLELARVPPDVAALSDILLLEGDRPRPTRLEDALSAALPRARLRPGQPLAVAWEIEGLGFRDEGVQLELSVDRTDRNLFRRVGEFLGLSRRLPSLTLSWEEPGPDRPGPAFRHLDLDLPPLDPGDYQITLTLRTAGRSDALSRRAFEVVEQ